MDERMNGVLPTSTPTTTPTTTTTTTTQQPTSISFSRKKV
jgi:hypothetical protein